MELLGKGVYSQCSEYGIQTLAIQRVINECRIQLEAAVESEGALSAKFLTAYGRELECDEVFKYLGCLLVMDDNDMPVPVV